MKYLAILVILLCIPIALGNTPEISGALVSSTTASLDLPTIGNLVFRQSDYDPQPAEPGQLVTFWLSVQNFGEENVDDVYVRIVPEYPFILPRGTGIEEVGRISGFKERSVEFELIVDEEAVEGLYDFDVQQCSDSTCSQVLREFTIDGINVKTGGVPRVRVGIEEAPTLWGGKTGEVTLNMVNRGKLDIKFLTIILAESNAYTILSTEQIYIGDLDSSDFDTADFNLFVDEDFALEKTDYLKLPVTVEYTDSNNKDYTSEAEVSIKVYSQEDLKRFNLMPDSSGSKMYLIIALLAVGFVIWKWRKKKRKH